MGSHGNPQTVQMSKLSKRFLMLFCFFLHSDDKSLYLKRTLIQLIEFNEVKCLHQVKSAACLDPSPILASVHNMEGILLAIKGEN